MQRLVVASSILGLLLMGIIVGIAINQPVFSGLLCLGGWSPACIFLGFTLGGLNLSISIKPKEQAAQPAIAKPTENTQQIKERVSRAN